jgi:hypothetical protein
MGMLWEVLKIIFRLLNLIEYSVVDSTKLSDWLGGFMSYS